ncbi:MAG TPA: cation:proton antiporter [Candidatus Binataceae bacterium]|nr:cation:proton antiporter [Candidatus Binataceae bacterium]
MPILASHNFLQDLALVLCVAALTSAIFQALRQPLVVGYLVAGLIVGPHLPIPLFADVDRIHKLSELGMILLMFALGLEFSVRKLARLAPSAGIITAVQVGLLMWLGYVAGLACGWTALESIFTGAMLAISSTTIIAKAFADEHVDAALGDLVFGVTLFEDLAAIILLAVLTAVATGAGLSMQMVGSTVGHLVVFLAILIGGGLLIVPRAIRFVAGFERDETLIVASVGVCFAFSMIAELTGYSVALGSFLAGVLVAESGHSHKIEQLVAPLRDIFGAVFFVSVGMMLDPQMVARHWHALLLLVGVVLAGKIVGVTIGAMLSGSTTRMAVQAGMSMAQIGEFSFIIAGTGVAHHATGSFIYSLAIAVSAITTFMTPFMIRASGHVGGFIDRRLPHSVGVLQTIYDSWIERMHAIPRPRRAAPDAALLGFAMAAIVAIAILYEFAAARLDAAMIATTGFAPLPAAIVVRAATIVLAAIPAAGIWRSARRLARTLAGGLAAASPPSASDPAAPADLSDPATALLTRLLELAIIFGAVTLLLALTAPFMRPVDGIATLLAVVVVISVMVWRSARDIRLWMNARSGTILRPLPDPAHPQPAAGALSADLSAVTRMRLPDGSGAIGRSLGDLNLREHTGAIVVGIARDSGSVMFPDGLEVLREGDALALVGPAAAIAAARDLLTARRAISADAVQ